VVDPQVNTAQEAEARAFREHRLNLRRKAVDSYLFPSAEVRKLPQAPIVADLCGVWLLQPDNTLPATPENSNEPA
jgi:hypothetical protein